MGQLSVQKKDKGKIERKFLAMKKTSKLFSVIGIILCLSLLLTTGVWAYENPENAYTVTYSQEPITDVNSLIDLFIEQAASSPALYSEDGTNDITVKQLVEERVYGDGHKERDFVSSSLLLLDKEMNRMTPYDLIQTQERHEHSTGNVYGVSAVHKLNYTATVENVKNYIKFRNCNTMITANQYGYSIPRLDQYAGYAEDLSISPGITPEHGYTLSPSKNVWYTLNLSNINKHCIDEYFSYSQSFAEISVNTPSGTKSFKIYCFAGAYDDSGMLG